MSFFTKAKLSNDDQLIFLDYLKQSLKNGFSLNKSLEIMPKIWTGKQILLSTLSSELEQGKSLDKLLIDLGFSKTIATQINIALIDGNIIDCLDQLTNLIRLKNKQIKKIRAELAYPVLLMSMMIFLLIALQTFLKTEMQGSDMMTDLIFTAMIVLILSIILLGGRLLYLLRKQDYKSLKKVVYYPVIGSAVKLYIQYLLIYDLAMFLNNGFSLQQICSFTQEQTTGSIQQIIGTNIYKSLQKGDSLKDIVEAEFFLPNSLIFLATTGSTKKETSKNCLLLGKTIFYELNIKLNKLVVNLQPICFIFIGVCILGMYLKILMPMYNMMQNI